MPPPGGAGGIRWGFEYFFGRKATAQLKKCSKERRGGNDSSEKSVFKLVSTWAVDLLR